MNYLEITMKDGTILRYNNKKYEIVVSSDGVLTVRRPAARNSVLAINKALWITATDTGDTPVEVKL